MKGFCVDGVYMEFSIKPKSGYCFINKNTDLGSEFDVWKQFWIKENHLHGLELKNVKNGNFGYVTCDTSYWPSWLWK